MASDAAVKKGAHAGNIIREVAKIAGGGGGGKPNMAQAGGKNPEKVDEALQMANKVNEENSSLSEVENAKNALLEAIDNLKKQVDLKIKELQEIDWENFDWISWDGKAL